MKKIGFTIGKFAPFHKGHQYLIEKAIKEMDEFYVIVYETDVINIPVEVRADWIKRIYPQVNILYAKNPPMEYGLDEKRVKIQIDYLKEIIKGIPVTDFYSSEPYGKFVAKYMNVNDDRVDSKRVEVPICATNIRKDISRYKEFLDKRVYDDYKKYL